MNTRRLRTGVALAALAMATGCETQIAQLTQAFPGTAPYLNGRATPPPFSLKTGNITGFVYGASGKSQPIPLAFVTTGSISAFSGNPDKAKAIDEAKEFDVSSDATKPHLDVMHDFNDGAGPVETDRILRKNVPAPDPNADDAANSRRQYVYLRAGEFFLEGVPEGITKLTASFGNVASTPNPITVYPNQIVTGVTMNLYLPQAIQRDDGGTPKVVEWTGLKPETGVSVQVQNKSTQTDHGTQVDVTINYKPDPPDVAIELKAPPGSGGSVIKAVDLIYVFNTSNRQLAGKPPQQIGPIRVPIPPVVVAPAQAIAFGPPAIITIPIGSSSLRKVFEPTDSGDQPGLIVANMEFIDDTGFAIQDKSYQNLQVSAVLRSL